MQFFGEIEYIVAIAKAPTTNTAKNLMSKTATFLVLL